MHDDLLSGRLAALDVVDATVRSTTLTEEEVLTWMGAINDLRLVLGTRLDVSEDMDVDIDPSDPEGQALAVYHYLSFLLDSIVDALAG